ncbi:MAG: HdeD family acid-resistance protein [Anaerolineales bacterium]
MAEMTAEASIGEKQVPWWLVLVQGIAAIIIGVLLLIEPRMTTAVLVQVMGIYFLVAGIVNLVSLFVDRTAWGWKLVLGILGIIAGLMIIQYPLWSSFLIPATIALILGIEGLIFGVVGLVQAFQGAGWGAGILGVLTIIFGILLILNPVIAGLALPFVLGIFAVFGGILALVAAFQMR